jgi:hypothetical protein
MKKLLLLFVIVLFGCATQLRDGVYIDYIEVQKPTKLFLLTRANVAICNNTTEDKCVVAKCGVTDEPETAQIREQFVKKGTCNASQGIFAIADVIPYAFYCDIIEIKKECSK